MELTSVTGGIVKEEEEEQICTPEEGETGINILSFPPVCGD